MKSANASTNFSISRSSPASLGGQVRLGDIATITDRFDLDEVKTLFNGKRAAILKITKTPNEDTLDVIDAVSAFIAEENRTAPPNIELTITNDGSSVVRDRLAVADLQRTYRAGTGLFW